MSSSRLVVVAGLAVGLALSAAVMAQTPAPTPPPAAQPPKTVVKTRDDLPRHTYRIEGKASEFLVSDEPFKALMAKIKADAEADLERYDIGDPSTLQEYHALLQQIAVIEGRYEEAVRHVTRIRELEPKESKRLMIGQVLEAMIAAERTSNGGRPGDAVFDERFKKALDSRVRSLPWEKVREQVIQSKGTADILRRELIIGQMQGQVDPIVAQQQGAVSGDIARGLVSARFALDRIVPLQPMIAEVYGNIIADRARAAAGDGPARDVWTPNQVELDPEENAHPVVIAVWDSGVDVATIPQQAWVNTAETAGNNKDDDGNGFVDDVNGIAFDLDSNRVSGNLADLSELRTDQAEISRFDKGFSDLNAGVDSPEATALKKHITTLEAAQVTPFLEDLALFGGYNHGTHVAGIAAAGNPFARILVARITFDHHAIPVQTPSIELAQKDAAALRDTIEYFKKAGVRVVNMSFGGSRQGIEDALEAKGVGASAEERAMLAREIFKIGRDAMEDAMKRAPEILFIAAAGNSDEDNQFAEVLPSGLNLPNMITIGAIDQTGKPTSFTTFGSNVRLYANGFEVESAIPGGQTRKYSGTSMAAPNAANLAGKLLAIDPTLTTADVIELMERGADPLPGHTGRFIINPKKSIELARARRG